MVSPELDPASDRPRFVPGGRNQCLWPRSASAAALEHSTILRKRINADARDSAGNPSHVLTALLQKYDRGGDAVNRDKLKAPITDHNGVSTEEFESILTIHRARQRAKSDEWSTNGSGTEPD